MTPDEAYTRIARYDWRQLPDEPTPKLQNALTALSKLYQALPPASLSEATALDWTHKVEAELTRRSAANGRA